LGKSEREFKRQKLQELYLAFHRFNIALGAHNIVWIPVITKEAWKLIRFLNHLATLFFCLILQKKNSKKNYPHSLASCVKATRRFADTA
jgi:hypothetical protein